MFEFKLCSPEHFEEIKKIQEEAFEALKDTDILRKNTDEMLFSCLNSPHVTVAAFCGNEMAGFSVLYFPDEVESIAKNLSTNEKNLPSANYKLCIVREKYRGNGLQIRLYEKLEEIARERQVKLLCATVSPKNEYSMRNVLKMGFSYDSTQEKYGLTRNLYYKILR